MTSVGAFNTTVCDCDAEERVSLLQFQDGNCFKPTTTTPKDHVSYEVLSSQLAPMHVPAYVCGITLWISSAKLLQ